MDFTSSITLQFNDLFSPGFAQAQQSVTNFKTSLDDISTTTLDNIVPQSLPQPDIPQPVVPAPAIPRIDLPQPTVSQPVIPAPAIPGSTTPQPVIPESGIPKQRRAPNPDAPPTPTPYDAGLKQIKTGLDQIQENSALNTVATQLSVMANMTAPLRNSLSNMMNEPSRLAGTFESSMKNIQAITGMTSREAEKLGTELNRIGGTSAAGPLAVADAYSDVAGGITKIAAQMPVLENALALAEAGQADLAVATNGLVKIMNSYNFTTGEVAEINERAAWASDVMTQAVGMGVGSMNEFVTAMAPVSGLAASVGVGFDEIGSTMAYMTATTDTAATAGTKLQAFMAALQRPSDSLAQALAAVGITSGSAMLAEYGLAASAQIVSDAFGGNQDAIAQAMGRMEAVKAIVSLTGSTYSDFAAEFGSSMAGITASAQAVQTQSYESKLARFKAASSSLKVTTGQDINAIKGFFVDMGAGFLTHVVNPIVSSPVGGIFRGITAVTGLGAQGLLSLGSGALNAAAQFSVLAVNVKNFGGYANILKGALSVLKVNFQAVGAGIVSMGGSLVRAVGSVVAHIGTTITQTAATFTATAATSGYAAAMWAAAGATWAALWPVLAVVAAVALVAGGVYAIIKNWSAVSGFFVNLWNKITGAFVAAWNWIKNVFNNTPNWVLGLVAAFFPFIGIPLLIIKNWDAVSGFFVGLWNKITGAFVAAWNWIKNVFNGLPNWVVGLVAVFFPFIGVPLLIIKNWNAIPGFFVGLWNKITAVFSIAWTAITGTFIAAWGHITSFFTQVWNSIVSIVASVAAWFGSVWESVTGTFIAAWGHITSFFTQVWNGIVSIVASVAAWFGSVWESVAVVFAGAWTWISDLFTSIWEGIKGVVLGFVEWLSPVIDAIIAPFMWIGDVIGGIIAKVGGWFGDTVDEGNAIIANMPKNVTTELNQDITRTVTSGTGPADSIPPAVGTAASTIATSSFGEPVVPPAGFTAAPNAIPAFSSAVTVPAAASIMVPAPAAPVSQTFTSFAGPAGTGVSDLPYTASSAFSDAIAATIAPALDMSELERQVDLSLPELPQSPAFAPPVQQPAAAQARNFGQPKITIEKLYVQAEDFRTAYDLYNELVHLAYAPEEEPV
jgi:TP901 family phage tail tape measure protein